MPSARIFAMAALNGARSSLYVMPYHVSWQLSTRTLP